MICSTTRWTMLPSGLRLFCWIHPDRQNHRLLARQAQDMAQIIIARAAVIVHQFCYGKGHLIILGLQRQKPRQLQADRFALGRLFLQGRQIAGYNLIELLVNRIHKPF